MQHHLIKNQNPKYIGNFNYDPRPPLKKKSRINKIYLLIILYKIKINFT
jgi:hypothetical protein